MSRLNIVLGALAVVQIIVLLIVGGGSGGAVTEGAGATGFKPAGTVTEGEVSRISISDGEGKSIVVARGDEGWKLEDLGDYPARDTKVESTLRSIRKLYALRELTRDPARFGDLGVADSHHGFRITVKGKGGADLADFYLGEQGSNRLVYRPAGEDVAYAATGPSTWEFDTSPASWVDTKYVDLDQDAIRGVKLEREGGTLEIVAREEKKAEEPEKPKEEATPPKEAGETVGPPKPETPKDQKPAEEKEPKIHWVALVDGQEKPLDDSKVKSFLGSLSRIYMAAPVGKQVKPEQGLDEPTATATITMKDGTTPVLKVGKKKGDENEYYFKSSSSDYVVTIRSYTVEDYFQKKLDDLLPEKTEEEKKAEKTPDIPPPEEEKDAGGKEKEGGK